ncbi:8627_t:CDS:10 [Paraglomus brasilianum]|uniref:8627_t:CDS:1 n=1 Tax=Paraglomus brasilianum TaxID=144538 RepID=A0A9N8VXY3_9GLOM|nr:8627_t:CDS:10 [Paraglomus brasilianum]
MSTATLSELPSHQTMNPRKPSIANLMNDNSNDPPPSGLTINNLLNNDPTSHAAAAEAAEASNILILLSNQNSPSQYQQRESERKMSDAELVAPVLASLSNAERTNRPNNTMSIASLLGNESPSTEQMPSIKKESRYNSSNDPYQEGANQMMDYPQYGIENDGLPRKPHKRLPGGSPMSTMNARVTQKSIQKQPKRPSPETPDYPHRKVPRTDEMPPHTGKLSELMDPAAPEDRKPVVSHQVDWERSSQYAHGRQLSSSPISEPHANRYHPSQPIPKNSSAFNEPTKPTKYGPYDNRSQLKSPPQVQNGYPSIGNHPDSLHQPQMHQSQLHQTQMHHPQPNGLLGSREPSAFTNIFPKKYHDMKSDPKLKRNATHAYITYMIYTNNQMERIKDPMLPQAQQIAPRQPILHNNNTSPVINNDHHVVSDSDGQMITPGMYGSRVEHPNYPIPNHGYPHPSEQIPRRSSAPVHAETPTPIISNPRSQPPPSQSQSQQPRHSIHPHPSPGLLPVQQQGPPHPHAVNAPTPNRHYSLPDIRNPMNDQPRPPTLSPTLRGNPSSLPPIQPGASHQSHSIHYPQQNSSQYMPSPGQPIGPPAPQPPYRDSKSHPHQSSMPPQSPSLNPSVSRSSAPPAYLPHIPPQPATRLPSVNMQSSDHNVPNNSLMMNQPPLNSSPGYVGNNHPHHMNMGNVQVPVGGAGVPLGPPMNGRVGHNGYY